MSKSSPDNGFNHATVLFADLEGYTRLVGSDEQATLDFMDLGFVRARELADETGGDLIKTTGDGFVIIFRDAAESIRCAQDFHLWVCEHEANRSGRYRFRVGIHSGEIRRDQVDIYGHAVNVAARLEGVADSGSTLISREVYRAAKGLPDWHFETRGIPVLKNVSDKVVTFNVIDPRFGEPVRFENRLLIQIIDGLSIFDQDDYVSLPETPETRVLVGCLALSREYREQKSRLAALIWPELPDADAVEELQSCWTDLQAVLTPLSADAIAAENGKIGFDDCAVIVDLRRLLYNISKGKIDEVLLEGLNWDDQVLPEYDELNGTLRAWVSISRKRWRAAVATALENSLERFDADEQGARYTSIALLNIEPGHEPASRKLISHHIENHNRVAAIQEYRRLKVHLRDNYGIEPDPAIEQLVETMRAGNLSGEKVPTLPGAQVRKLQITISKFEGDRQDHSSFGFRAELAANLSRFREWTVVDRAEVAPVATTASNGQYTIHGEYGNHHKKVLLKLRLLEGVSGKIVWSESIEVSMKRWNALQRRVIGEIAAKLELYISADRLCSEIAESAGAMASFDQWLRGEMLLSRWDLWAEGQAAEIFEAIIARDDSFAQAYSSLASIYNVRHIVQPGLIPSPELTLKALALGQRAIEIDPMDARSQLALAWSLAMSGNFEQALVHTDLALHLNPNSPKTAVSAAMGYAFFGDTAKALKMIGPAIEIGSMLPTYLWCYIATVQYLAGDYEAALESSTLAGDSIDDNQGWRCAILSHLGRHDDAARAFAQLVENVTPYWAGSGKPSCSAILNWFVNAYPIRDSELRELLEHDVVVSTT
ncbi:MAG: hypothetical protein GY785_11600 [Gammaproteobacteria bacterium]|nr:hypothetical protein [Gammaproteobacteria bacterium]